MIMRKVFMGLLFFTVFLFGLFYWASGRFQSTGTFEQEIAQFQSEYFNGSSELLSSIKVMTWNISYAYGIGSEGKNYQSKSRDHYINHLEKIAETIREQNADVVLIQEIDFAGKRSYDIDQLKFLAEKTGLVYGARAKSWRAGYVPFPYWPPSEHFGKLDSGGAVLSRFPIKQNLVSLYPRLKEQPWWYRYFYPLRYHQMVDVLINNQSYWLANLHFEAFNQVARFREAKKLANQMDSFNRGNLLAVGGDFNTTPSEAKKRNEFGDHTDDSYVGDDTLGLFRSVHKFSEAIQIDDYVANEARYFTFPSTVPNRRLDYIFVNKSNRFFDGRVVDAGDVSDHLPFMVKIELNSNR